MILFLCLILTVSPLQGKPRETYIAPWTAMDRQDFRVRSMYEYYVVRSKMSKDKWQEKLTRYCENQNIIVSVCSYCGMVLSVKKGGRAISHGVCYTCLDKVYAEMDLMPDPDMPRARAELNEKIQRFEVFKRSG
jgi:hypothetical protein